MKKSLLLFGLLAGTAGFMKAQNVYIPDTNFKNALLTHAPTIDTNGDGEIQVSEAVNFYGEIGVVDKEISDLTGIEAFINISGLSCGLNSLTTLDLTNNKFLRNISCFSNQLTSLIIGNNNVLEKLYCRHNQLTNLDVSNNPSLGILECYNNQLTKLNLKNGHNSSLSFMYAWNNPNLTCIQVDNVGQSNSYSGWYKDPTASYSTDCSTLSTTDISKKEIALYPNPVKDLLHFSEEVSNIRITDVSGRTVKEFSAKSKSVNVANLAKGIYIITAVAKSGETVTKKIVKE